MARSFSLMGLPKEFNNLQKSLGLKKIGKKNFKEYFYSEGYEFKIYQDKNGRKYEEFEAGCPWDGGPTLYLGLKNDQGEVICSWTPSQMGFTEEVNLPAEYIGAVKEICKNFVKEENEELVKGYCGLYIHLKTEEMQVYQSRISDFPKVNVFKITLKQNFHGSIIRDFLTQEGFSVEETTISAEEYIANREKYLQ